MANETTNIFEEFKEELNISQIDADSVLKAIDEKIIWYGKRINNPKYKAIVPIKTKALKELRAKVLESPNCIEEYIASLILGVESPQMNVYGISFGTTYSSIAYIDERGRANSIEIDSSMEMPSVVAFDDYGSAFVGDEAKEMLRYEYRNVCAYIKEQLGNRDFRFRANNEEYTPEFITALILKKLVEKAKKASKNDSNDVVLTFPAYFGIEQKQSLITAAKISGINVVNTISEPLALAIAFSEHLSIPQTILIYDLGGATLDITIIRIDGKNINIVTSDGFKKLGGGSWDLPVIRYVINTYCSQYGESESNIMHDDDTMANMVQDVELAKKKLSHSETTYVKLYSQKIEITRDMFEQLTLELLERTIMKVREVIEIAFPNDKLIDKIILAGGASLMPQVKNRIVQEYPNIPVEFYNSNMTIAKGAAIYGSNINRNYNI